MNVSDRTLAKYLDSIGARIDVSNGIIDRTSLQGMTPEAIRQLQAAVIAAQDAGLSQIVVTAAKGGGHLSHKSGTEWDIKGVNEDGSRWTNAQRVAVAKGARKAGADRFGLYQMDKGLGKGTLHFGYSGPGRPAAVWGAGGQVRGAKARAFTNPDERSFAASALGGVPAKYMTKTEAQKAIAQLGFTGASAIKQFQRAAGIKTDGKVGRDTTAAINNALSQGTTYAAGQGMAPVPRARPNTMPETMAAPVTPVVRQPLPARPTERFSPSAPMTDPKAREDYYSGPAFAGQLKGKLGLAAKVQDTIGYAPKSEKFSGPAFNPRPASNGLTSEQLARYAKSGPAADGSDIRTANSPLAGGVSESVPHVDPARFNVKTPRTTGELASALAKAANRSGSPDERDFNVQTPQQVGKLADALTQAALKYSAPLRAAAASVAGQAEQGPLNYAEEPVNKPRVVAPVQRAPQRPQQALPSVQEAGTGALWSGEPDPITNDQFNDRWQAVGTLRKAPEIGKPPGADGEQEDPWAATPKVFRPAAGLGFVGGLLGNMIAGPAGGLLGRTAGKAIGGRLTPTQLPELKQKIGEGLAAILAVQGGAPLGTGQYVTARNNASGYQTAWSRGPNGAAMQTVYTPSGRTYSTYSIGPSLSPMEVVRYGGSPMQSRTPSGGNPTTNPRAGGVY